MVETGLSQLPGLQGQCPTSATYISSLQHATEMPVPRERGLGLTVKGVGTVSIHLSVNAQ